MLDSANANAWDFRRISPARSLALIAMGATAGLGLAGYSLFTTQSTTTLFVPAEDVALVNQQPISRSDYYAQLQSSYRVDFAHATPEQRSKALQDMIREELFVQRGKELDVSATDPDVRTAMVSAVEQMAAADAITSEPGEGTLREYFQTHPQKYQQEGTMTVRDLVFSTGADAAIAIEALRAGDPAPTVLARFHGSSREPEEDFYFAANIHLGDTLFAAARSLSAGEISGPTQRTDGFHVLYMLHNTPPQPIPFETAKPQVLGDYRADRVRRMTMQYQKFLRKRANVLIAPDLN